MIFLVILTLINATLLLAHCIFLNWYHKLDREVNENLNASRAYYNLTKKLLGEYHG